MNTPKGDESSSSSSLQPVSVDAAPTSEAGGHADADRPATAAPEQTVDAAPTLPLPTRIVGRWRRDWRVRAELVGKGIVLLTEDGVHITGRKTTPPRSALRAGVRLLYWSALVALSAFVLLTASGLTFRTGNAEWLLITPTIGLPLVLVALWPPAALVRRWLQPRVSTRLDWSEVRRLASDGTFLELNVSGGKGALWGRLRPRWWGRYKAEIALRSIRDGALPDIAASVTTRRPRSPWWDRGLLILLMTGALAGGLHLRSGGRPAAPAVVAEDDGTTRSGLARRAEELTRQHPELSAHGSPAATVDAITEAADHTWDELDGRARTATQQAAVDEGILAAMPWPRVLGSLSMTSSLPRIELARQRLDGRSETGRLGRRFMFSLAQAFLDLVPARSGQWSARVDVAEAWMEVHAGDHWTLDGRTVQVPDATTAQVYQAIGYFILADLARTMEQAIEAGEANWLESVWVGLRLRRHGINLDIQRSSATKATLAWGTGDFEYVIGRLWLKALQQVRDEAEAIEAAKRAGYRIGSGWSSRDGAARTGPLLRSGDEIGWVALTDPSRIRLRWSVVRGSPSSSDSLMLASGAYVTSEGQTAGLSVQEGRVVNYLLDRGMGGLVVIDGSGHLSIHELDAGVRLRKGGPTLRPLEDLGDLYLLLDGLRQDRASAFQTHVLAADGKLTIRADRSSPELRERRLLIDARYKGNPIVGLVDIPGSDRMSLHEAAVVAMAALETGTDRGGPGLDIEGIANLDVGSYDILDARSDDGRKLRRGPVPLTEAKNLLRWERR